MRVLRRKGAVFLIVVLSSLTLTSLCLAAAPLPEPGGPVVDTVGVLETKAIADISALLKDYEEATGNQIRVVIIPSLNGEPIEDYAVRLAYTWGIGQDNEFRGIVILLAMQEKMARIAVGSGLTQTITDQFAAMVLQYYMLPEFRNGAFDKGILDGLSIVIRRVSPDYRNELMTRP